MKKKILGISGSPRKNGNTDKMVNYILRGAPDHKYETDFVRLYDITIKPCIACNACHKKKAGCVIKDGLPALLNRIKASDVLVFGTPVYWWGPSAGFKAFMDRWYGYEMRRLFKRKRIVIAIPLEDKDRKTAAHVSGIFKNSLDYLGADILDIILSPGTSDPGDIDNNARVVKKLKEALSKP